MMRSFLTISFFLVFFACAAFTAFADDTIRFGSFATSGLEGWAGKEFKGVTEYTIVSEEGKNVLQAVSNGGASGLVFETEYEPADYPLLSWTWKVSGVLAKGDSRSKQGDDYAARVYVIFPHWFFPKTKTLNYIWANKLEKEAVQANAYTGNAMMIAVESGADKADEWVEVRRNIVEDYRRAFGEDPPAVGAIAIMSDTDNTGESATAWYGDIFASRE